MAEEQKNDDKNKDEKVEEAKPAQSPKGNEAVTPKSKSVGGEEKPKEEPKVADKAKEEFSSAKASEDKKVEVPAKFKDLVKQIESLSITDLAELVKILEKKFGVSPMTAVAAAPAAGGATGAEANEEKSSFNIELKDGGSQKIQVIKVVREITGKGLKEAKDLVDGAPQIVKENAKKEEAEEIKKKLEEAGATVELK